jgi:hypothetical protein
MPHIRPLIEKLPWKLFLTGLSLAVGLAVPSIYELGQKPAARSRHYGMEHATIIVLMATMIVCMLSLLFRRIMAVKSIDGKAIDGKSSTEDAAARRVQFRLRQAFIAVTVIAVILALMRLMDGTLANGLVAVLAFAIAVWGYFQGWHVLARLGTLYASMFLPCVWMILFNKPFGHVSGLAENIPTCPGIIYAGLLSALFRTNLHEAGKLAVVFVIVQLLIGAWLAKRGGKLLGVYLFGVLVTASLSSLLMHALYRA